jgi:hypothetical protein
MGLAAALTQNRRSVRADEEQPGCNDRQRMPADAREARWAMYDALGVFRASHKRLSFPCSSRNEVRLSPNHGIGPDGCDDRSVAQLADAAPVDCAEHVPTRDLQRRGGAACAGLPFYVTIYPFRVLGAPERTRGRGTERGASVCGRRTELHDHGSLGRPATHQHAAPPDAELRCPGRNPPQRVVKRPPRPYKTTTKNPFTVENAKAAWPPGGR